MGSIRSVHLLGLAPACSAASAVASRASARCGSIVAGRRVWTNPTAAARTALSRHHSGSCRRRRGRAALSRSRTRSRVRALDRPVAESDTDPRRRVVGRFLGSSASDGLCFVKRNYPSPPWRARCRRALLALRRRCEVRVVLRLCDRDRRLRRRFFGRWAEAPDLASGPLRGRRARLRRPRRNDDQLRMGTAHGEHREVRQP